MDPSRQQQREEGGKTPTFAINASFELPTMSDAARNAVGFDALRGELWHRRDDFARGFTEKMMIYALPAPRPDPRHRAESGFSNEVKRRLQMNTVHR